MSTITVVLRVPLADTGTAPLDQRIRDLCDVYWVGGYRLCSAVVAGDQMVLVFQPK
jgi:hypothetical protein